MIKLLGVLFSFYISISLPILAQGQAAPQRVDSSDYYLDLSMSLLFRNLDSTRYYIEQASLFKKDKNTEGKIFRMLGIYHDVQANYDSALYYYDRAEAIFKSTNDQLSLANILNNKGLSFFKKYEFKKAILNYQSALDIYEQLGNIGKQARVFNNLGLLFIEIKDLHQANIHFDKAIEQSRQSGDVQNTYNAMHGKAEVLHALDQSMDAIVLYDSVATYFRSQGYDFLVAKCLRNAADCCLELDDYSRAKLYLTESLNIKRAYGGHDVMLSGYSGLVDLYIRQGKYKEALVYVDSLWLEAEHLDLASKVKVRRYKATVLANLERYKESALLYEEYAQLSDSLDYIGQTAAIKELSSKYIVAKKDKEIAELALINEQAKREVQLGNIWIIAVVILLVLIVSFVLFYNWQQRQRASLRQALLHEKIDGLRLRIGKIISDVQLEDIEIDSDKLQKESPNTLTEREMQILQLAITNKTNAEISEEIFLSVNTVKYHLKNIYAKLGVSSRLEARQVLSKIK